jgi:flagellar biosynthesis repressor protein FlbT
MALTISLKPKEQAVIGGAVVCNDDDHRIRLTIKNNVIILREKDVLRSEDVDTPCKRLYFSIQLMYIDQENIAEYHKVYWKDAEDIVKAAPSCYEIIEKMSKFVVAGDYYKALKQCKELIQYERKLLSCGNLGGAKRA